jgi:hypothetical protein
MRPRLILLLALALLAVAADTAAASSDERRRACAKRGVTVASSPAARVFEVRRGDTHTLYACLRATGRRQSLVSWYSCDCSVADEPAPDAELMAARFVLLSEYPSCGPFECTTPTTYTLRDLRSKREVYPRDDVSQVVTGAGFFAYSDGRVVMVRGRSQRVLDEGPGVEPGSLAVAGDRLYWIRDGEPQLARGLG